MLLLKAFLAGNEAGDYAMLSAGDLPWLVDSKASNGLVLLWKLLNFVVLLLLLY